ncbi:hypothetical protein HPP92_005655 [Vanilla planifolia]|uniref:Uncharacterized protein n=1 Tax=Vanilla planifolia TaxID=51239 RepID=A0A835RUW6_VANPL|nr:hypothetical protein HPP92_005655 [Vanilla planifolia]
MDCQKLLSVLLLNWERTGHSARLKWWKAGIVDDVLEMLLTSSGSLCSLISELLRILTNNSGIAKSEDAARIVEPLFSVLHRTDIPMWGQHSAFASSCEHFGEATEPSNIKINTEPSYRAFDIIPRVSISSHTTAWHGLLSHLLEQEHFQQRYYHKKCSCSSCSACWDWNTMCPTNSN